MPEHTLTRAPDTDERDTTPYFVNRLVELEEARRGVPPEPRAA